MIEEGRRDREALREADGSVLVAAGLVEEFSDSWSPS